MYTDPEILPIIEKADAGCPKSQFVMWDYYYKGRGVPKSKLKSLDYGKMVAAFPEAELSFIQEDSNGYDLGQFYAAIGIDAFALGKLDDAEVYTARAKEYFLQRYTPEMADKTMKELRIEARLAVIEEMRQKHCPVS